MNDPLDKMKALVNQISEEESCKRETCAVLLFGSVVKETVHKNSDIDIIVVKDRAEPIIARQKSTRNGITIDLWEHSLPHYTTLLSKSWKPQEMFSYSLFLNILQECQILYDPTNIFEDYKNQAMKWRWAQECLEWIETKRNQALHYKSALISKLEKLVCLRKFFLLS